MKRQAGLWIDHREAFVAFAERDEEGRHVESGMEKHVRFSGGNRPEDGSPEDRRDRNFTQHLDRYYDHVIDEIRDADSILIFGPGEAKAEFAKRLATKGLGRRVVGVEAADKMTPRQIAAKVRQHFRQAGAA